MHVSNKKYPMVSVITVSFNSVDFIGQTIQSVVGQTYPHIEYIIIDGSSKDGTVDIIRQYASRLAYWHSEPDKGIANAFNLGLKKSHGDWILFLNADDFFDNNEVVAKMIPYLIKYEDADVVFGQSLVVSRVRFPNQSPYRKC